MVSREQYERLAGQLESDGRPQIVLSIASIERIIGEELPASARKHRAWWGSDPKHTESVWLDVGYVARPDFPAGTVTFNKGTPQVR